MEKPADADYPILDVIKRRWSPRAFGDRPVEPHKMRCLLEAARWAASSYNEQPWRFMVVRKSEEAAFEKALSCLVEANQAWARNAAVLLLTATKTTFAKNDKPNRVHQHDLGLAMANLSLQATAMGLFVHQMAGIDRDKVRAAYQVPDGYEPQTAAAIGYPGDPGSLSEDWMRDAEQAPRTRHPMPQFVFGETWEQPAPVLDA